MTNWKCDKCGFRSKNVKSDYFITKENGYEEKWIDIRCKKCDYSMFYNGA